MAFITIYAFALGCLLEEEDKSLLLKTPQVYDMGQIWFKLDLTLNTPYGLTSIVTGITMQASQGGDQSTVLSTLNAYEL